MRNAISTLTLILTLAGALITTGCLNNEDPAQDTKYAGSSAPEQGSAFREGKAAWSASKPPSYSFQLSRNCFCFPYGRMEVFVDADKVVKVDTIPGVEGPYDIDSFQYAPNIDEVFGQIEGYLNNPEYEVRAQYDAKMGYPTSVKIHHVKEYMDADAEYEIASFRPVR
jgi:hypothetical protein